jgi:hypothetical protein
VQRLLAVVLALLLPCVAVYGLLAPCACANSVVSAEAVSHCCGGGAPVNDDPSPCSGPCDNCACELANAPEATEFSGVLPSAHEGVALIEKDSEALLYEMPLHRRPLPRSVIIAAPPRGPTLSTLCVRLL